MAFGDNSGGRLILKGYVPVQIILSGTVKTGDLIGDSSGSWVQADGNNAIYAELVAGQHGSSGDKITCYRVARVGGITTGTKGAKLYLSDDAGGYSASAGTVSQRVGFELGDGEMLIEPKNIVLVRAEQVDWDDIEDATAARVVLGNSSNRPTPTAITGVIGITNAGVVSTSNTADDNVVGGVPVIHRILLASGADANHNVTLTHKTRILDAWVVMKGAGTGGSAVTFKESANAITDAIDCSAAGDKDIVRAGEIDDAQHELAAGEVLRVATASTGGDFPGAEAYVLALRVA